MFSRLNDALQSAADVLAPPPTALQSFEYHWKHIKTFYESHDVMPKIHIENTTLPAHLEEMLKLLIDEDRQKCHLLEITDTSPVESSAGGTKKKQSGPCLEFVLANRPFDLLTDIGLADSPPGASVCIMNWMRRFLTCLELPKLDHKSILQPVQKLIAYCSNVAGKASPYEQEEIVFLLTVAGIIRKDPLLIHLFLPAHEHTWAVASLNPSLGMKTPTKNTLFDAKLPANVRKFSLLHRAEIEAEAAGNRVDSEQQELKKTLFEFSNVACDCADTEIFELFDTVLRYFDSADSVVVVRACEAALILVSLPTISYKCMAQRNTFKQFGKHLSQKLAFLCQEIPEDMDTGDIEDCVSSWGLMPRDSDAHQYIGKPQLMDFLCWLDYCNSIANECYVPDIVRCLAEYIRIDLFEMSIEPMISVLDMNIAGFMLVLLAKIIKQIDADAFSNELATWLVGSAIIVDGDDLAAHCSSNDDGPTILHADCLFNIIVENAQDNLDILLPTLQFVESLLDNANERILYNILCRYVETRGYYDANAQYVQTWSDEEDEREKRRSSASQPVKSTTLKPNNILKVINNFLLLLPRQIISDSIGTCYEEYVQDANRHYKNWIAKTSNFDWPIEAMTHPKEDDDLAPANKIDGSSFILDGSFTGKLHSCDSGIAVEQFYEGPLLRLLFNHVRNMAKHPYELNIAVIAILSKLSFLPHPYLHEILLNPEIPITRGTNTLWSSMQALAHHLLLEIPRIEGFQKRITETARRLLINPPILSETYEEYDHLFESLVALEEFCKELAAIAFVKYHHATE